MADDDSFDIELANLDIPSEPKKSRLSAGETATTNEQTIGQQQTSTKKLGASSANQILVNPKQRGNPILKAITKVPWTFEEMIPDYVVGITSCILYLSLKYHNLNPEYLSGRLKELGKRYELRVLLVQVDIKDPHTALKHLTRLCFLTDLTLMLAWTTEEAGRIIETYKLFENKSPDLIMERAEQYPHQKLVGALTNIKPVNKTDAMILLQTYGNLANLINSSEDKLSQCSGLGPRKAKKLYQTFNEPFLKK